MFWSFEQKNKVINRLHIYSRRHQKNEKHSVSTGNLSLFDEESVVTRLDKKLKEFANKRNNNSTSESIISPIHESFQILPKEKKSTLKLKEKIAKGEKEKPQTPYDKVVDRQLSSNEKVKRLSSAARRYKVAEENEKRTSNSSNKDAFEKNNIDKNVSLEDDLLKKDVLEEAEKEASSCESEESAHYTEPETASSSSEESEESTPVSSQRCSSSKIAGVNENGIKTSFQSKRLVNLKWLQWFQNFISENSLKS